MPQLTLFPISFTALHVPCSRLLSPFVGVSVGLARDDLFVQAASHEAVLQTTECKTCSVLGCLVWLEGLRTSDKPTNQLRPTNKQPTKQACSCSPSQPAPGLLVGWFVGWLAGWLFGWLVGWPSHQPMRAEKRKPEPATELISQATTQPSIPPEKQTHPSNRPANQPTNQSRQRAWITASGGDASTARTESMTWSVVGWLVGWLVGWWI